MLQLCEKSRTGVMIFVERNNNIVLEYKKKHALKISLPESVQGDGESIIPVTLTINNASGGIKSVQWNDSVFTAAGGKISGNGTSWQVTLPAYKSEGVNSWNVGATVQIIEATFPTMR